MTGAAGLLGPHAVVAPIVLPLVAGALLLLLDQAGSRALRPLSVWLSVLATLLQLALAVALLLQAAQGEVSVYLLGNWQVPFGIALALDRLSALMLLLTLLVATGAVLYALGGDDRHGPHFHALLQFQLMGLAGAFLTADLFNLFVFFEVLLAASYGLLLHGGTRARLKASVHYVVFNLTGSALFLIAVSLLYALTGTLNMADLARKLPLLPAQDVALAQAAGLLLLVVLAVKAALLPLYFWLPDAYASASAPTAALFAVLTKVGVYAIARVTTLMFGAVGAATPLLPLPPVLTVLALATLILAAIGALAAQRLRALVAYLVVASSATVLLAVGLGTAAALAAGLFYLVPSTLVAAAWFLLADRIALARGGTDALQPHALASGWAPLGAGFFIAAVAVAGVPPLAAFMGKALLLQAAGHTGHAGWTVALVLASSLTTTVALARAGSVLFWEPAPVVVAPAGAAPAKALHLQAHAATGRSAAQPAAVVLMLAAVLACTPLAGPLSAYTQATAQQLLAREGYLRAVLSAKPVPAAHDVRRALRESHESQESRTLPESRESHESHEPRTSGAPGGTK